VTRYNRNNSNYNFFPFINAIKSKLRNTKSFFIEKEKTRELNKDENEWRQFNAKVNELTERRKKELQTGILESDTKKELSNIKPIADQFNFIMNIATSLEKSDAQFRNDNVTKA
jgi:hypothetical protein